MADKKYPTRTSILGKLIAMAVARHGSAKGVAEPTKLLTRLEGLAIMPHLPDEEIEAALRKLIDAGEFAPPQE